MPASAPNPPTWPWPVVATELSTLVRNAEATLVELQHPEATLPMIIPDLKPTLDPKQRCWVTCLESAVVGYVIDEWKAAENPTAGQILVADAAAAVSSLGPWRRAIQVGSLPFSTTLRTPETERVLWKMLPELREKFPDRPVAVRHVRQEQIPEGLPEDGVLLPARLVYSWDFSNGVEPTTRNFRRDRNLFRRSGLVTLEDEDFDDRRVTEALELYRQVYRNRHSLRHADYTPELVAWARSRGWLSFCGLADPTSGALLAFCGMHDIEGVSSTPMLGYETGGDSKSMLYRHVFAMSAERTLRLRMRDEASSGSGEFKRHRGYTPAMEHLLVFPALIGPRRWSDRAVLSMIRAVTRGMTVESMIASGG